MSSPSITAIILTKDEEQHLRRALECAIPHCRQVIVVDSGSRDGTEAIAREMGARWEENAWVNYATQFNHGLALAGTDSEWILRLDADEILDADWYARFSALIAAKPATAGVALRRLITFRGKTIRHGLAQTWQLRLFRAGLGTCEARWMDEHIVVDGPVEQLPVQLLDDNLNDLKWWTQKHLGYADREAVDLLLGEQPSGEKEATHSGSMTGQAKLKRWLKDSVYARLPIGLRAFLFFILRYVFALGFLDGLRGFQFHFLQGFWYRLYTDIRLDEIRKLRASENLSLEEAIHRITGLVVTPAIPATQIEQETHHG